MRFITHHHRLNELMHMYIDHEFDGYTAQPAIRLGG